VSKGYPGSEGLRLSGWRIEGRARVLLTTGDCGAHVPKRFAVCRALHFLLLLAQSVAVFVLLSLAGLSVK